LPNYSLDFIFASHVFENFYNPFGHLKYWSEKIKQGGLLLLIIPQQSGRKDFRQSFPNISHLKS
tara:strand:+ start:353 stop:544 length:192 start_codon:yes stop_codon:yes gene_type:complete